MAKRLRAADPLPWLLFVGSLLASFLILPLSSFQSALSNARASTYNDWVCGHSSIQQRFGFAYDVEEETQRVQADIDRMQQQLQLFDNNTAVTSLHAQKHALDPSSPVHPMHNDAPGPPHLRPFLFVGVLSVAGNTGRRTVLRQTWMAAAPASVIVKFVLYEKERTIDVQREKDQFHDIIFVQGGTTTDYRSIVYKTFAFIQWVAMHAEPKFVLKTDDDAYVSSAALVDVLQGLCSNPDCHNERMYFGQEKRNGVVITEEDSKWSNLEYFQLTGLKEYVPYMLGGGYAFSFDVAQKLHELNGIAPLKLMPNEDATFGFWVMGMQLRHIAHPKVRAAAGGCCFHKMGEEDSKGASRHLQIRTMQDLCSGWLILHKVETEGQMAYLHHRLGQCPPENELLERARQLGKRRGRPAAQTAPHKVMPLQVAMVTDSRSLHHYWSHSDVTPWSADGRLMLSQRADVAEMQAQLDSAQARLTQQIGFTNFTEGSSLSTEITGWNWTILTTSSAWNLQLGSRLQWLGPSNRLLIFNDHDCHQPTTQTSRRLAMSLDVQEAFEANSVAAEQRYMRIMHAATSKAKPGGHKRTDSQADRLTEQLCSVVFDIEQQQRMHVLPRPVYAVSSDGQQATSFSFDRLDAAEAGWGYGDMHAVPHYKQLSGQPQDDGLWLMHIPTKQSKLLISIHDLSQQLHKGPMSRAKDPASALPYNTTTGEFWTDPSHCFGYISAATFNAEGSSIAFKYHTALCSPALFHPNHTYIMTINLDGSNLWRIPLVSGEPAGLDYGSHGNLIISENSSTYLVHVGKHVSKLNKPAPIAKTAAGPCKFYPHNNRYVVCDSFYHPRKVYVWDLETNTAFVVGTFAEANWPSPETGRRGLHTHFTPDGQYISFDSSHIWETGIQTYIAGLQHLPIAQGPHRTAPKPAQQDLVDQQSAATVSNIPQAQQALLSPSTNSRHDVPPLQQAPGTQLNQSNISTSHQDSSVNTTHPTDQHAQSQQAVAQESQITSLRSDHMDPHRTDMIIPLTEDSQLQSRLVRRLYLCLAAHNGNALDSFLQAVPDPSEWEVFVWQAPESAAQGGAAQQYFEITRRWQAEVSQFVSFAQAAGLADGNTTVAATGESFFDVSMSELSHVLLPRLEPKLPKFDKRSPEWLHKQRASWLEDQKHWLHCLLSPAACQLMPWKHIAGAAVEQGNIQDQRSVDFPRWLKSNTQVSDEVVVHVDLGTGREFEILQELLISESLSLVDHIDIRWHYQAENWHLVLLWEYVLSFLGIGYTSL